MFVFLSSYFKRISAAESQERFVTAVNDWRLALFKIISRRIVILSENIYIKNIW